MLTRARLLVGTAESAGAGSVAPQTTSTPRSATTATIHGIRGREGRRTRAVSRGGEGIRERLQSVGHPQVVPPARAHPARAALDMDCNRRASLSPAERTADRPTDTTSGAVHAPQAATRQR